MTVTKFSISHITQDLYVMKTKFAKIMNFFLHVDRIFI